MRRPPRLYFSLRSPFSWMAVRQLAERRPDYEDVLDVVPFFEPSPQTLAELEARGGKFHYTAMSKAKHLYILTDTKRLAAKFGYDMKWPIDVAPQWELPHLAWLKAKELGVHRAYYDAVMASRWERGEDICDPPHLRAVCEAAGLDADTLLAAPEDPAIREQGLQALMDIYEDDVFGVPYFKVGRHRFWGLDRLDGFLDALEAAIPAAPQAIPAPASAPSLEDFPEPVLQTLGSYDHDTAGGCG